MSSALTNRIARLEAINHASQQPPAAVFVIPDNGRGPILPSQSVVIVPRAAAE